MALTILSLVLIGCSKEDDNSKTITNLSGTTWYDAQVWFRDTEGGELSGYSEVGMVTVGGTCTVSTNKASDVLHIRQGCAWENDYVQGYKVHKRQGNGNRKRFILNTISQQC